MAVPIAREKKSYRAQVLGWRLGQKLWDAGAQQRKP